MFYRDVKYSLAPVHKILLRISNQSLRLGFWTGSNVVPPWINVRLRRKDFAIAVDYCRHIAFHCGDRLCRYAIELCPNDSISSTERKETKLRCVFRWFLGVTMWVNNKDSIMHRSLEYSVLQCVHTFSVFSFFSSVICSNILRRSEQVEWNSLESFSADLSCDSCSSNFTTD